MGTKRLPAGEAERRAAERKRAFWAGEKHAKYDPIKEGGFGSPEEWAAQAERVATGRGTFKRPEAAKSDKRVSPDLRWLGLEAMPSHIDGLKAAFRKATLRHHPDVGGTKENFQELYKAYERLVKFY